MSTSTEPPAIASRYRFFRWRPTAYWLATAAVVAELGVGGSWDITRIPSVRELVTHLGYPSYFLVLLGTWKVLGAAALLIPRSALLKEWAYAGAFFTYTGAIVSHLTTGYDLGEVRLAATMTALTVLSWALRPPSRRTPRPAPGGPLATVVHGTPGAAQAIPVPGRAATNAGETDAGAGVPSPAPVPADPVTGTSRQQPRNATNSEVSRSLAWQWNPMPGRWVTSQRCR